MEDPLVFDLQPDELEIFLQDVNEHLQSMEAGILELERAADLETLNSVFRAAHTLKALAGTVGHYRMAEITHTVETLFDSLRESGLAPAHGVIDELLAVVDILKALRDEIVSGRPSGVDVTAVQDRLRALIEADEAGAASRPPPSAPRRLTPEERAQARALRDAGEAILEIEIDAAPDAFAPAARLMQAAMALVEVGQVITQSPTLEELASDYRGSHLWVVLATRSDPAAVEARLEEISDLARWDVRPHPLEKPAPAPAGTGAPAAEATDTGADKTVRISVERLDTLMNLVGELVTSRTRLSQIENALRLQYGKEGGVDALGDLAAHFGRVVDQLQEEVMRARMLPIAHLFGKFPRLVRDVARAAGKQVDLVIEGEATELDRSIIEVIGDPLIHLLRNAVDHGIEPPEVRVAAGKPATGTVRLAAAPVEGQIVITVEDDGRGIDPARLCQAALSRGVLSEEEAAQLPPDEVLDLIFRPGFSTAEKVTEVSGRGVGMDVVRTNVEKLGGSVVVESVIGRGTIFRVTLPLTLAIVDTMLVSVGAVVYAIPLSGIIDSLYLSSAKINTIRGSATIRWRESVLPLLDLRQFFAHPRLGPMVENGAKRAIITVAWGKIRAGLIVDRIIGKQEVVIKSLSPIIGKVPGLSGGAILGDGRIALIVDVPALINSAVQARKQGMAA